MNTKEAQNQLKLELKEVPNEQIAHIHTLLCKLATIEYENYKEAA